MVPYKGKLAEAINYARSHRVGLMTYLEDGNCSISNNHTENSVRLFAVGRKNWLFCGSPIGSVASETGYSLIETAKVNNMNPYKYLLRLLQDLPALDFRRQPELLERYLH